MRFSAKYIWAAIILCYFHQVFAVIYQWTDAQGIVHYSDEPSADAQSVHLAKPNIAITSSRNMPSSAPAKSSEKNAFYTTFQIAQPQDQSTIRNNQRSVTIILKVLPVLQKQDKIRLWLDGQTIADLSSTTYTIFNVTRGAHQLQAQIIAPQRKILMTSQTIIFYLQQAHSKKP